MGTGHGQFNYPTGVAVDSIGGNVYVVDERNHRIQKFDSNGHFLLAWGSQGSGPGQFSFTFGIAVDFLGHVYVVDHENARIQEFSSSGDFLLAWGMLGSGPGQFNFPEGVAVNLSGSTIFVADTFNERIQKFGESFLTLVSATEKSSKEVVNAINKVSFRPIGTQSTHFVLEVTGQSIESWQLQVFNLQGQPVYDSSWRRGDTLHWSALDTSGRPLANGVYLYVARCGGMTAR